MSNTKEIVFPKNSALIAASSSRIAAIQRKAFDGLIYCARNQLQIKPIKYKYTMQVKDLIDLIGTGEKDHAYLNKFLDQMQDIKVQYNILNKDKIRTWGGFNLLAGYEYANGTITYSFPFQIQDAIIDPKIYAWIDMTVIKGLKSKYTIAMYELAQDYINLNHPFTINLDKFRKIMGVGDGQYYKFSAFRVYVIDAAVNEINNNSHIKFSISITPKKTGRKYSRVIIGISKKIQEELPEEPKEQIDKLIIRYPGKSREYIRAQMQYVLARDPQNFEAYLRTAIEKNYARYFENFEEAEEEEDTKNFEEQEQQIGTEKQKMEEGDTESQKLLDQWAKMTEEERFQAVQKVAEKNSWVRGKLKEGIWKEDELIPITVMLQLRKS